MDVECWIAVNFKIWSYISTELAKFYQTLTTVREWRCECVRCQRSMHKTGRTRTDISQAELMLQRYLCSSWSAPVFIVCWPSNPCSVIDGLQLTFFCHLVTINWKESFRTTWRHPTKDAKNSNIFKLSSQREINVFFSALKNAKSETDISFSFTPLSSVVNT